MMTTSFVLLFFIIVISFTPIQLKRQDLLFVGLQLQMKYAAAAAAATAATAAAPTLHIPSAPAATTVSNTIVRFFRNLITIFCFDAVDILLLFVLLIVFF